MSSLGSKTIRGVRRVALVTIATMMLGTSPAWATVMQWSYDISTVFDNAQFTAASGTTIESDHLLAWGDPANQADQQSSLVLDPFSQTGNVVSTYTGGGNVPAANISDTGIVLTHNNYPVYAPWLESTDLVNTITLTADDGGTMGPLTLLFGINFNETSNTDTSAGCVVTPMSGNDPCPDILVIDNTSLNSSFTYDGQEYFLSLFALNDGTVGLLPGDACEAAGVSGACQGFVTQENSENPLGFGLTISTQALSISVPAPGTLALLGLALLGMAGVVRRRQSMRD